MQAHRCGGAANRPGNPTSYTDIYSIYVYGYIHSNFIHALAFPITGHYQYTTAQSNLDLDTQTYLTISRG